MRTQAARIRHPTIFACFDAYKADIDDLRESPSIEIALRLAQEEAGRIFVADPHIETLPPSLADAGVRLCSAEEALAQADIVLGLVPHTAFRKIFRQALQEKIVIDTCGLWG